MLLLGQCCCRCLTFVVLLSLVLKAAGTECNCGFGYELVQQRLDSLETRLLNPQERSTIESCLDVTRNASGIYKNKPQFLTTSFPVYCDMSTLSGGWTIIQHRYNGVVNFTKSWQKYRDGFGILGSEYWMGLERLHQLTANDPHELIVHIETTEGRYAFAHYSEFAIDGEREKYKLSKLGSYSGKAGDYLRYHEGMPFSTPDSAKECASYRGGWWFDSCFKSHLNGQYGRNDTYGLIWGTGNPTTNYSKMMIRKK